MHFVQTVSRMRTPMLWLAAAVACVLPMGTAAEEEESNGSAELLAVAIPAIVVAVVMWTIFFLARTRFPNVYAPRANWMRHVFQGVDLPDGIEFVKTLYNIPEKDVIDKVGADGAVFLRVFKMGLELFCVCSVTAIMLIAVNATGENELDGLIGLSMANIEDGSSRLWAHCVGMWMNSAIIYYSLWKNYNEILAITQEYKSTKMRNYSVLVRNVPPDLREEDQLLNYFKEMWQDTHDAIMARQIGKLVAKTNEYKKVVLDLAKTMAAWEKKQNDPKLLEAGKVPERPRMRRMSVANPAAGLTKVDKIDYLEEQQRKLRAEIDAMREDVGDQKPSSSGFVTFTSIATANAAAQTLTALAPGTVEVTMAPEPREVYWPGVIMPPLQRKAAANTITLLKIPLVWGYVIAILFITSLQNLDSLTANPGMGWLDFINDLPEAVRGIVQGLIPVILLAVLMALLPVILRIFAQKSGVASESEIQSYVFGTHFTYQVVFVFFLTMLASAIFDALDTVLADPTKIFSILGETVPGAGNFFIAYVMLQALGAFPGELARVAPLILQKFFLRNCALDTERMRIMEPGTIDYGTLLPKQLIIYLIVLAYSVLHPIISFIGVAYFGIGYLTWKHQLINLYTNLCESGGTMWHRIFKFIMVSVFISQATLIGVVAVKLGTMGPVLIPLPIISYIFFSHFDGLYGATVSSKIVAREVARNTDKNVGAPSKEELDKKTLAFKQPQLVYDLDDILYHTTLRCTSSECLAHPPPKETWILYPGGDKATNLLYTAQQDNTGESSSYRAEGNFSIDDMGDTSTRRVSVL
eukprot:m.38680 g.38680  ORF g.38680 m.38680 type:complete len:810 (+) comp5690_c0_seq2:75-2504(+)